jgi:hydrogenase expression/formation protein HypE
MSPNLQIGKIDPDILGKLISDYTNKEDRVLIGAGIGEDAAIIDMGSRYLVAKTDPITHVTSEIGHYAVNINANDIAAMGGKPMWFLATILMPAASSADELKRIFSQLCKSCKALGISYCGGHTEVTHSVNNPVVIGQMLGEVERDHLKPTSEARLGDDLIMTKSSAIEATAIIALEKEKELSEYLENAFLMRAKNYLYDPGISVIKEASVVSSIKGVHALHDPTEGGIVTGIFEMATASGLGVEVYHDKIPISVETRKLCEAYHIDPLGTFASGSLLIAVSPLVSENVIRRLATAGIMAARIGVMMPQEGGLRLISNGEIRPLPVYHQDELSKILG